MAEHAGTADLAGPAEHTGPADHSGTAGKPRTAEHTGTAGHGGIAEGADVTEPPADRTAPRAGSADPLAGCAASPADAGDHERHVARLFDAKAATWRDKYSPGGRLTRRLAHLTGEVLRLVPPGSRVLDLGCGTADLARSLAVLDIQVVGCDISGPMLAAARAADARHTVALVRLPLGWRRLPFAGGVFDAVLASSVLEYTPDPAGVLRECARVLRPGGLVLATVPDPRHPVRWLESALSIPARSGWARSPDPVGGPGRRYLAYLRTSRQRHSPRWWLITADAAGLCRAPCRAGGRLPALRLVAFTKIGRTEHRQ